MKKKAIVAVRDSTGLSGLIETLESEFDFEIVNVIGFAEGELKISIDEAKLLIDSDEVSLVIANYYDVQAVGREFMSWKSAIEAFDFDLVDLVRLGARRPQKAVVIGDPAKYENAIEILRKAGGEFPQDFRISSAIDALRAASEFDGAVSTYLETHGGDAPDLHALGGFPRTLQVAWKRDVNLPEGENRNQQAAVYGSFSEHFKLHAGPDLDYASVLDLSFATFLIGEFEKPTIALIRRNRILAAASGMEIDEVWNRLSESSASTAKGATLVANNSLSSNDLRLVPEGIENIIAPSFAEIDFEAGARYVTCEEGLRSDGLRDIRSIAGGVLVQDRNRIPVNPMTWRVASAIQPMVDRWDDMILGAKLSRHLISAACVAIKDELLVDSVSRACDRSQLRAQFEGQLKDAVLVFDEDLSDRAQIEAACELGVAIIVHPGVDEEREPDLVDTANNCGIALVNTGVSFRKL